MPKQTNLPTKKRARRRGVAKLGPQHKYVNFVCVDCDRTYSRSAVRAVRCPDDANHRIGRVWGSKKQNVKFARPDDAIYKRSKRKITKTRKAQESVRQELFDDQLRRLGFDDLDDDDKDTGEDYDYANPANFNPNMRYTNSKGSGRACRDWSGLRFKHSKASGVVRIANAVGRPESPGSVMGKALGVKAKSAQRWAGRGKPYKVNRFASLEWCHLQADSLGGPTSVDNLVAASFAANTEMLVIEHELKGKTQFGVEVGAFGDAPHVAEFIEYKVYRMPFSGSNRLLYTRVIDARNDYFTKDDAAALSRALKDALKK